MDIKEEDKGSLRPTRKKTEVAFIALFPALVQVAVFFAIADWAAGAGSGKGMMGLFSFIMILFSMPLAIIINIFLATYVTQLHFFWVLLLAIFIALALPLLGAFSILLVPG